MNIPTLNHVHSDGFTELVLAVKEYRTYPSGFHPQTHWALVMRARKGKRSHWELVPLSELMIATCNAGIGDGE